jgi:hypothetical protein
MNFRTKQRLVGAATGGVVPVIFLFVAYYVQYRAFSPWQYMRFLVEHEVLSKVASLCVLPNLVVFFIAIAFDRDSVAHGTLLSTIIWALVVAAFYFAF